MLVWLAGANAGTPVTPIPYVDANGNQYPPNMEALWTAAQLASLNMQSVPTPLTPDQQAAQALAQGVVVTSTATPALNGTYACDAATQSAIQAELVSFLTNGTFTNGQTSRVWPDVSGGFPQFTEAQFKTFATAIAAYVDAVDAAEETLLAGGSATFPANTATIP